MANRIILRGGRIIDTKTRFDAVADLVVSDGVVQDIVHEYEPGAGDDVIDVTGKWVIPGHIDAHAHFAGPPDFGFDSVIGLNQLALAGVTTAIDLGGSMEVLYESIIRGGTGINVASLIRVAPGHSISSTEPARTEVDSVIAEGLSTGSIGAKMWGGYYPLTPEGTARVIESCNRMGAHVAFHVGTTESGSRLDGLREIPEILGSNGRLHIAHVNAYCRGSILKPNEEVAEALQIIESLGTRVVSEVHMAVPNFTRGDCGPDGEVLNDVPRNCLRLRDYAPNIDGMRSAISDGYGSVVVAAGDHLELVSGKAGLAEFERGDSNVPMSFPVNLPSTAFALTSAKDANGKFIVDAVASDGGILPRNVNIEQTIAMVRFGALEPLEAVEKLSYNPARMFGLENKGRLEPGADADITVIDPQTGVATDTVVGGKPVLRAGKIVGSGGTVLITDRGQSAATTAGVSYEIIEPSKGLMYSRDSVPG
ncbi:MAG: amidohydrolase family protein [Chloroflexi bacterium]|nr:amidohydrolase family protein [Chloroflexota bacterium]